MLSSIGRSALLQWIQRGSLFIEVCGMLSLPLVSAAQPVVADIANNHWLLDEMLPVQQGGLPKGVCAAHASSGWRRLPRRVAGTLQRRSVASSQAAAVLCQPAHRCEERTSEGPPRSPRAALEDNMSEGAHTRRAAISLCALPYTLLFADWFACGRFQLRYSTHCVELYALSTCCHHGVGLSWHTTS